MARARPNDETSLKTAMEKPLPPPPVVSSTPAAPAAPDEPLPPEDTEGAQPPDEGKVTSLRPMTEEQKEEQERHNKRFKLLQELEDLEDQHPDVKKQLRQIMRAAEDRLHDELRILLESVSSRRALESFIVTGTFRSVIGGNVIDFKVGDEVSERLFGTMVVSQLKQEQAAKLKPKF